MAASSAVLQSPAITIEQVAPGSNNSVTLQYTTNLLFPTWRTLGKFSGSTNLYFINLPAAFFRGICTNLTVSTTVSWPASSNPSVVGYKIYYGQTSGNYTHTLDVGPATQATIANLLAGRTCYFAVTAYDASGTESPPSNETSCSFRAGFSLGITGVRKLGGGTRLTVTLVIQTAVIVPTPRIISKKVTASIGNPVTLQYTTNLLFPNWQPLGTFSGSTNLTFTNLPAVFIRGMCSNLTSKATLAWSPSTDPSVAGYTLYYGTASHQYTSSINVGDSTTATVPNLVSGRTYYFAVTAYDSSGVESPFSNEASGAFQARFSLNIGSP